MDESILTCVECVKMAQDPVKLTCQHTFCLECAKGLMDLSYLFTFKKNVFQCTICSSRTQLKEQMNTKSATYSF